MKEYSSAPVTITGKRPPTAAELDHQRWMNREPARIDDRPMVISMRPEPTLAEQEAARRAGWRPADKSARAIRQALANVQTDAITTTAQVQGLQEQVQALLTSGAAVEKIKAARAKLEDAQIGIDQLHAMEGSLKVSLARAEDAEAEALQELAARVTAAKATVTAFRKAIEVDLPKAARAIAAIVAQETAAEAAMVTLRAAANQLDGHDSPEPLPLAPEGKAWRVSITLPGYLHPPAPYRSPYAQ